MRRFALLLIAMGSLLVTSTGAANAPSRFTFTLDQTFPSGNLTAACGFPVFVHIEGTQAATIFYDTSGTVVREIDTSPGFSVTFFAPSTGGSFTYPGSGAFIQEYVNGTAVGSHLVATLVGLHRGAGPGPPDAGRTVFDAVVAGVSPEGIPAVEIVDVISDAGHRIEDITAARCAVLSGP